MMHKKGQGAMEYLMTYGWAILVVIIVGVVLWQMGVFTPGAGTVSSFSGFGQVKPLESACSATSDDVSVVVVNGAGATITGVNITADGTTGTCSPTSVPAGNSSTCTVTDAAGCAAASAGSRFESTVTVSYVSPTGLARDSTGKVWGAAE